MNEITDIDAAYIAGFLDGDGSIGLYIYDKYTSGRVTISNTNQNVLKWVNKIVGIGGVYRLRLLISGKTIWEFCIRKQKDLNEFLNRIYPYLKIKNGRAEEVMGWLSTKPNYILGPID